MTKYLFLGGPLAGKLKHVDPSARGRGFIHRTSRAAYQYEAHKFAGHRGTRTWYVFILRGDPVPSTSRMAALIEKHALQAVEVPAPAAPVIFFDHAGGVRSA